VQEDEGAGLIGVLAGGKTDPPGARKSRQPLLALDQRQALEIMAVKFEQVEGIKHGLATVPWRCGASKIATHPAADYSLAVECERYCVELPRPPDIPRSGRRRAP
jgi:hypothetical protein